MLSTEADEILFDGDGKVTGVRCGKEEAEAPLVICDPSYVKDLGKTKVVGKVVRAICIMENPIPNTDNSSSVQIILPQKQLKRNSGKSIILLLLLRRSNLFNTEQTSILIFFAL